MANRDDLVARIQRDLARPSASFATTILDEINSAIDNYQKDRFWFSDSRSVTLSTIAGQADYSYPTEFYEIDEVTIVIGGVTTRLRREDWVSIETSIANYGGNGQPWSYAYLNGGLRVYPRPDKAYAVRFLGHFKVPAPATGTETGNPWMNDGFELIRAAAKLSIAVHVLEDDALAQRMVLAESRALKALRKATYLKTGSGNITPTEF